ncbi:MAG: cold shock domain-containing protein [Chloroflexi bacterium]|nr:cold shock domain-containing protein [Chloroflexota bacterium]
MADQRLTGTVKSFDAFEGQGVIVRDDGGGELFLDVFGMDPGTELKIQEGVRVEFRVLAHTTGLRAEEVTVLSEPKE